MFLTRRINRAFAEISSLSTFGRLFVSVVLIVIFEGAIRKWGSKDLTNLMVIGRDLCAVYGIYVGLKWRLYLRAKVFFKILAFASVILIIWGLIQLVVLQNDMSVFLIGLRFWLLYLWFAAFASVALSVLDLIFIQKLLLLVFIFMTPLVIVQHLLPPDHFLNKQVDEGLIFTIDGSIVRTTGTFSFTMGYTTFIASVFPFVFSAPPKVWLGSGLNKLIVVSYPAMLIATIVSGSRAAAVYSAVAFVLAALLSLVYVRGFWNPRVVLLSAVLIAISVPLASSFSGAALATKDRFENPGSENLADRMLYNTGISQDFPLLGFGVGSGNNFAGKLSLGDMRFVTESETGRIFFEVGLFGFFVSGLKLFSLVYYGRRAMRIAKRRGTIGPPMVWFAIAYGFIFWPIIGQLTINAFGYLLFGLGLALVRDRNNPYAA